MGVDSHWMTPGNWSGDTMPQPGDDLVFPSGATSLQAVNDFAAGTSFGSITIEASGYALSGNAVSLTGGVTTTYSSGTSTDAIDTDLGGGTITVGAGGELDLGGVLSGSAGLSVSGGGTVDLSGDNTYDGMTTINNNGTTLLVDGTIGAVQVNPGAVLGGSGTVGNVTTTAGTISPGDGPNVLNTGSLTLDGYSTYLAELDGSSPGVGTTGYDQVVAGGAVDLDSALLDTGIGGGYVPTPGDQLTILQNNSGSDVTGTFAGLGKGNELIISGRPFRITYQGGASKQDVVLTALAFTTIDVSASSRGSTYGDSVTFTAQVIGSLGTPTGTVDFFDGNPNAGGTALGSDPVDSQGVATFSTTTLDVAGSPYQIFAAYNPDISGNYASSTTTQPASLTVIPAPLTITANDATQVYGDPLPAFTFGYSGFQNGETASSLTTGPSIDTSAAQFSPVTPDGYTITPTGAVDPNYTFTYVPGTLTVNPAPLTVTGVTANSKMYDGTTTDTLDTTSADLSGMLNGDQVSVASSGYTATFADQNVGTGVVVTVSGLSLSGTDAGNFTLVQPTGLTAEITPAVLAVTANAQTMTYGGTVPALTYGVTGLASGDTTGTVLSGSLATTASSSSHVGGYPISIGTLVSDANYTISFTGATLSITQAPLTITANDASIVYGAAIPAFTASYSGFVNGDTAASLTTPPTLTTSATSTSPVGIYEINGSGASSND